MREPSAFARLSFAPRRLPRGAPSGVSRRGGADPFGYGRRRSGDPASLALLRPYHLRRDLPALRGRGRRLGGGTLLRDQLRQMVSPVLCGGRALFWQDPLRPSVLPQSDPLSSDLRGSRRREPSLRGRLLERGRKRRRMAGILRAKPVSLLRPPLRSPLRRKEKRGTRIPRLLQTAPARPVSPDAEREKRRGTRAADRLF